VNLDSHAGGVGAKLLALRAILPSLLVPASVFLFALPARAPFFFVLAQHCGCALFAQGLRLVVDAQTKAFAILAVLLLFGVNAQA